MDFVANKRLKTICDYIPNVYFINTNDENECLDRSVALDILYSNGKFGNRSTIFLASDAIMINAINKLPLKDDRKLLLYKDKDGLEVIQIKDYLQYEARLYKRLNKDNLDQDKWLVHYLLATGKRTFEPLSTTNTTYKSLVLISEDTNPVVVDDMDKFLAYYNPPISEYMKLKVVDSIVDYNVDFKQAMEINNQYFNDYIDLSFFKDNQ